MLKHRPQSVSRRMVSSAMQTRRDATYGTRARRDVSARLCRQVRHPTDHLEALRVLHDSSARREYCSARSKGGAGLLRPQIRPDASCGVESVLWLVEASRELLQDRLGPRLTWARASTPRTHQYCSVRQAAEQRRSNLAPPTDPPDGDATRLKHSVQMLRAPPPVCEVVVPSGRMPLGRLKPL